VVRAFAYRGHFFIGLGSLVMLINVILLTLYSGTCHSFRYLMGGRIDAFSHARGGLIWQRVTMILNRLNPSHGAFAWYSMFSVALTDVYIPAADGGVLPRPAVDLLMEAFETLTTDVLVIGAGGAGMRAAIEAAASGARVTIVCKSLLGKAHTVMAEGGVAAALGNVDRADGWQTHFQDTMRGGQMINNWRMAEIHAKESPDRVYELETWGAIFRSHAGWPHSPACLRRPNVPAPLPRRRSNRARNHPHPAGSRRGPRHRGPHGMDAHQAPQGWQPRDGRLWLQPGRRALRRLQMQGRDPRRRGLWDASSR